MGQKDLEIEFKGNLDLIIDVGLEYCRVLQRLMRFTIFSVARTVERPGLVLKLQLCQIDLCIVC